MLSRKAFALGMAAMTELYDKDLSKPALELYYLTVSRLEDATYLAAVKLCLTRSRFMPRPADILEVVEGLPEDRVQLAWETAYEIARSRGRYSSVCFEDPAINAAVRAMGGWIAFCETATKELPFRRREFADAYRAHDRCGANDEEGKYLPGAEELSTSGLGLPPPAPLLIPARSAEHPRLAPEASSGVEGPQKRIVQQAGREELSDE